MASKRDMLDWFVRERCKRVFAERVAQHVCLQNWDVAKLLAGEAQQLAANIGYEVGRTYSLVELEDIIRWRKRKVLDFQKERDD